MTCLGQIWQAGINPRKVMALAQHLGSLLAQKVAGCNHERHADILV
jgi:hypothetical protein